MKTISTVLLFALLSATALRAWFDFVFSFQSPGQVVSLHRGREGEHRTREYDLGISRYTVVDRDPCLEKLLGFFGAGAPELNGVAEGGRVTLWVSGATGRATPVRRMPLVTTIVPLLFLALLLAERRIPGTTLRPETVVQSRSDGSTEVRQDRHRCLGCTFLETLLIFAVFGALVLIGYGLAAPFLDGETTLREGLAFVALFLGATPVIAVVRRLEPPPSVRWNESTVWIHGVPFQRSAIRSVVLRNGILEIHREGSRWKRCFAREATWVGERLEKLGCEIERPAISSSRARAG